MRAIEIERARARERERERERESERERENFFFFFLFFFEEKGVERSCKREREARTHIVLTRKPFIWQNAIMNQ